MARRRLLLALIVLLALNAFPQGVGYAQQQATTNSLQYEVSVVLKLIHVYVTNKKGHPVADLAASDFSVIDNGKPVTVTDFERRILQATRTDMRADGPGLLPTKNIEIAPSVARDTSRAFFLFFDFAYNNPRGIMKARKAALHFLNTDVALGDEVALLSYSMIKGLVVHEYLTTDHSKVRQALETIGQKDLVGRADEVEEQYWQQAVEGLRDTLGSDPGRTGPGKQEVAETNIKRWESKQIAQKYLLGMMTLAKALRIVPGQKQFILFSSGIPASLLFGNQAGTPMDGSLKPGQGALYETGDPVLRSQAEELNKEFGASGCVFFVFDTRESAMKTSMFEREAQSLETGKRTAFSPTSAFEANSIYKNNRITGFETLDRLAKLTGGEYFSNIDRYEKNFDEVQALTGAFYVLGFPVNERWDGKFHEVKVEVKRKGCEVRAQAGYFNPKPFSEYSDLEKQLHLFDLALNERAFSRMPITVPMKALTSSAEGISRLAVLAKISEEVTAKFAGKRVEFVAIFLDDKGEISDIVREEVDPTFLQSRDMSFAVGSTLKPGDYYCRLVIRDMDTGLSAVASAKATIGRLQITSLQLGTPLILEAGIGGSFLYASAKKAREAFPWAEIYPFDSSLFTPTLAELSATARSIQVVIPCAASGGRQLNLVLSANLVNSTSGERSAITITRLDKVQKGPLEILTLELDVADVAPGSYYLHINAQDRASGALGHSVTALVILPKQPVGSAVGARNVS